MPDELVIPLGERTKFFVDSERMEHNPFAAGDMVTALIGPLPGEAGLGDVAYLVSDWATTERRMDQMSKLKEKRKAKAEKAGAKGEAED
jgi:hypothetical protein